MSYRDDLRDPRWQRRRLEILQRDEFSCRFCGDDRNELHVHHKRYVAGRKPWEYSDDDLMTLCAECHSKLTECTQRMAEAMCWEPVFLMSQELLELIQAGEGTAMLVIIGWLRKHPEEISAVYAYLAMKYAKQKPQPQRVSDPVLA